MVVVTAANFKAVSTISLRLWRFGGAIYRVQWDSTFILVAKLVINFPRFDSSLFRSYMYIPDRKIHCKGSSSHLLFAARTDLIGNRDMEACYINAKLLVARLYLDSISEHKSSPDELVFVPTWEATSDQRCLKEIECSWRASIMPLQRGQMLLGVVEVRRSLGIKISEAPTFRAGSS